MNQRGLLIGSLFLAFLVCGCSSKTAPEPIWVGQLTQLSGSGKAQGLQAERGARLAVNDAAAADLRVAGRPLAVRHVDTHGDADTARAEAVRLITISKASALLLNTDSAQAERIGRESAAYGVPLLVCCGLASPPAENVFVLAAGPEARGRALARFAPDGEKSEPVAVLVDGRRAVAGTLAAAFVQECRKTSRRTIPETEYASDDELKERISRVIQAHPAAVLVAGSAKDCLRVRADLAAAGLRVPALYGGEDEGEWTPTPNDDGADVYLATVFTTEGLSEKGRDFARRFKEAAGESPTFAAAQAFDGTRLLFEAIRQANSANSTKVREQLAKIQDFEGVTGPISFKARQARRPIFVVRVGATETKVVKTVPPDE